MMKFLSSNYKYTILPPDNEDFILYYRPSSSISKLELNKKKLTPDKPALTEQKI